jgi:hypothetical protein
VNRETTMEKFRKELDKMIPLYESKIKEVDDKL